MNISAVLCAHNEEGSVGRVIEDVRALGAASEIIVVDDGSTDSTASIARRAGAGLVSLSPNQGKGRAIAAGIKAARGDWILFLDADGQDPASEIPKLMEAAEAGAEFVNGSKFIGTLEPGAISRPNYLGNRFMSLLVNLLFRARITDSQSGFRLIRADFLRGLSTRSAEYEIEAEILIAAIRAGLNIVEVPVTRSARASGSTDFRRVRNGLRILWTIIKSRLRGR